jgi:hypothetical protein
MNMLIVLFAFLKYLNRILKILSSDDDVMNQSDVMKERLAFGRFVNEHSLQHIGFLDQKSSILVAINGVLLGRCR